jgi:transposase
VEGWIALHSREFRTAVRVVAIDPSAPYASGIRRALPDARIVLDHFHLVMLATAHRRTPFLAACAVADMPEKTRLAGRIEKWWPGIEGFLELGVTNTRTEGCNRVIKQIKRVACGFRNQANDEKRIMLHSATLRAA